MQERSLAGKVAIVTGAGRGIGRAIAIGYARAGASVCCAARTAAQIDDTANEIARAGGDAIAVPTDVTRLESVRAMVDATIDRYGGLDIVVINAGVNGERKSVEAADPERWREALDVNVIGAVNCAHAAIPHLKRRGGGKIITMGSGVGHRGSPERSAYACSKAALWMLTRVLAQELVGDNISVNELIPGPVVTAMSKAQAERGQGVFGIPGEWVKAPEDVVALALFLAAQPAIGPTAQSFSLMRRDT
jgi:3-oxoacyl-[acyl-carrier protein] reductase